MLKELFMSGGKEVTGNILDFLENIAEEYPDKTAVRVEDETITYAEFVARAKAIGTSLARNEIYGRPVGVYMEKGIEALSTFFGIVYAGGFYSMLNTELPASRLQQICEVLQGGIVITTEQMREKAEEIFPDDCIKTVEELSETVADESVLEPVRRRMIDTDPLYINFTSGSTGTPKGIVVSHRSVIDFIDCFTDIFGIGPDDVIANQAPFDFDVSVKDIYSAFRTGAELLIVPRRYFSSPTVLIDYLCDNKVTVMIWAVSALCLISTFHGLDYKTPDTIKKVLFSGEVMPYKHLKQWQEHLPDTTFINLYGPTEITCNCTYHILEKERDYSEGIPIGVPFPNEDVFLLSDEGKLVTGVDEVGKITVRGTALALGYYRMPEKNDECFIQNPLNPDYPETVYQTGDLGKYNARGEMMFCGRSDNQIKYMGHRVELEEVERSMAAIDGVERCFCVFEKEKLKGYYVGTIEKAKLHSLMKETLPVFMVPGFIRKLEEMPMTKNGKIDRRKAIETAEARKK